MDDFPTEWEWPASAISRPNGLVNAKCLDWPRCNLHSRTESLSETVSVSEKRDSKARDNSAQTARGPSLVSAETGT
jgi:hypothetical protein